VLRWIGAVRRAREEDRPRVRGIVRSFAPVVVGRGAVQFSAYVDNVIASLLPTGAVSALAYAQTLYLLPVSLFGMSVSAAELPELSALGDEDEATREKLRARLEGALRRMAFLTIPSSVAFVLLGDSIAGAVFQTGVFRREDALLVWAILAGSAVGLVAATRGRLLASAYYALRDVKTPLRFSLVRIALSIALGLAASLLLPKWLGIPEIYGTVGLTATAGASGWIEYLLLKSRLERRIGAIRPPAKATARAWIAASVAGAMAFAAKVGMPDLGSPILLGLVVCGFYGVVYFVVGALLGLDEAKRVCAKFGLRLS
jgi:putative peptidoglycan lipid II flippase